MVLEFNELCPSLLDRWMAAGELPNFKRFHDQSEVFISLADAQPPALEPWIQWYSVHTGLSYAQHGVFRLTDGPRAGNPDIWSVLLGTGLRTANFCSMNAKGYVADGSIFIPDPWCTSERAYPDELTQFSSFVARMVQEYSNRDKAMSRRFAARFLLYLMTHGLRATTIGAILKLLYDEKIKDPSLAWRRTVVLDWIQRDLFLHYFRKYRPDFATFFLNSTAHLQHAYWRHMDPDAFQLRPCETDLQRYGDAIRFGYKNMDRLLCDFFALEREGVTLVMATALSQKPFLKYEAAGGQHFYRPRNVDELMCELAIEVTEIRPTMTHQFMLRFADTEKLSHAAQRLDSLRYDGKPALLVRRNDDLSIHVGCIIGSMVGKESMLHWTVDKEARSRRFLDIFYMIDGVKSGCHHPEGAIWFKTGHHVVHRDKVSVLDLFPTILDFFGVCYAASDRHPFSGRGLSIAEAETVPSAA